MEFRVNARARACMFQFDSSRSCGVREESAIGLTTPARALEVLRAPR